MRNAHWLHRPQVGNQIAKRHAVIEGPRFDRHLAPGRIFEIRTHVVVVVAHCARLAYRERVGVVGAFQLLAGLVHAGSHSGLPNQVEPQLRCDH